MRWINRVGTAVIAIAVVVGPPLAVVWWIRAERWRFPTAGQVHAWIEQPPAGAVVAGLIASIAVALWLLLVYAVVHHVRLAITAMVRRLRRASLPSAAQVTAGSMAGVAALAMPGIVVHHPAGTTAASAPAAAELPGPDPAGPEQAGPDLPGSEQAGPEQVTAPAGIDVPGGWVPYRTALAVTTLGAAIWLYRRQHYQPGRLRFGEHGRDADLQPLPGTADAIIAGIDDQPPQGVTPASTLPDLPTGRLILHGPGAANAARGLLITAILSAALTRSPDTAVTVSGHDLDLLVGVRSLDDVPPGLHLDDTVASPAARESPGGGNHHLRRPTLVIRRPGHASHPGRAAQHVGDGTDAVTVVVVGDDGHDGRRWHVAADGTITADDPGRVRRLCLLDVPAATDLLTLVQQYARTVFSAPGHATEPTTTAQQPTPRSGQLRLLDGCRLHVDSSAVRLRRSAGLQVLAYLAVHPAGATTTELIRAIWPGLDPNTITKRLHTTLTDLRQQLQPTLDDAVIRHDERYRLNPDIIDTDLDQLRRAITAAATAVTDHQRHAAAHAIIDAYPGELAAGFSWPWLPPVREALRRDVIDAYLHLAAVAPPADALDLVRAATAADPDNQALHDQAQRILEAAGLHDAAAALRQGLAQRLHAAALRPPTATTDSPAQ